MAKKKQQNSIDLDNQRYGLFMTEQSFNLDIAYGRNYLETDNVQEVIIHKVNITKTKSHDLYGQTKTEDKVFFAPVKIRAMVTIQPSAQEYYGGDQGGIVRDDTGPLVFGVYLKELEEKNVELLRGDYVEYNQSGKKNRFYEIQDAQNITDTTDKTIGGFKSYWKKVTAIPVKEDVLPFLSETKGS